MGVQPISVPQSLAYVLNSAGDRSGVDFDYLLQTAVRESSLNPQAKAQSSSAVGLFQFLESTWLQVMKEEGPRLGYGDIAQDITRTGGGDYVVADPQRKAEILKLREDPQVASDLAAAFTKSNGEYLENRFGRRPSAGELYIAHFMGAQGAERLFTAGLQDPDQIAATLFPKQAAANPSIFYANGQVRTVREVYRSLVAKHEGGGVDANFTAQQMSGDAVVPVAAQALPSRFSPANMSFTGLFKNGVDMAPVATDQDGGSAFFTQLYGQ